MKSRITYNDFFKFFEDYKKNEVNKAVEIEEDEFIERTQSIRWEYMRERKEPDSIDESPLLVMFAASPLGVIGLYTENSDESKEAKFFKFGNW